MSPKTAQLSAVKQLAIGALMYAADWDGRLMVANRWSDGIEAYGRFSGLLRVDTAGVGGAGPYRWAFRRHLATVQLDRIHRSERTALIFDTSHTFRNAAAELDTLPDPPRYEGGDFVAFVDAHARWVPRVDRGSLK